MEEQYCPRQVEINAQQYWQENRCFEVVEDPDKEKFYCLAMFPYPSGKLHMGHVRNYTITDVIARYQRMLGKNVLHPMGWDAFGLPAENAAIQNHTAPAKWTRSNIAYMKKQLNSLGFGIDWSRELTTCEADYYKWEQWFFTRLYEKGLVYKKMATVNWDPVDQTVLANEQVIDGRGWRSGALVERKAIPQWFIKITAYAEELLSSLDKLDQWPEQVKVMQRNWIGKSRGVNITFDLGSPVDNITDVDVYTTRPDTLMGVAYLAVAAEHPLVLALVDNNPKLVEFIHSCKGQSTAAVDMTNMQKRGMDTGLKAIHPITGDTLPIWVTNYVLMDYGSGAVMAVPAHDERDHEFARQYGLPILQVIAPTDGRAVDVQTEALTDKGILIKSGDFNGLDFEQAFDAIAHALAAKHKGCVTTNYRLRDWGVSRQRYWGAPIPIFNLPEGGEIPVPLERLPVLLPEEVTMDGVQSPIKSDPEWRRDQIDGQAVERETDTFDTFMESSWYYARFTCGNIKDAMLDPEAANYWLPVDQYVGGIEHAILHLLYARFYHKLMRDEGLVHCDEPFERLLCQGMVLAETYYQETSDGKKTWFNKDAVSLEKDDKGKPIAAYLIENNEPVVIGGIAKMSKSKNNGVDPQQAIDQYGADTVRLFTMFAAPPTQTLEWQETGVEGASRFLRRLWKTVYTHIQAGESADLNPDGLSHQELTQQQRDLRRKTHETIAKVSEDYGVRQQFNTAIAAVMELINEVNRHVDHSMPASLAVEREAITTAILLMAPVVPHICHVLWFALGHDDRLIDQPWPVADESAMVKNTVEIVIQVNGKVRTRLQVDNGIDNRALETLAITDARVQKFTEGKTLRKVIVIPNKLVNIVI